MSDHSKVVEEEDLEQILHWLDVHSVSLSQGLPLNALMQKWRKAGRNEYRLGASLKRLFERDLVVRVPGQEPPHLRVTVSGYARLTGQALPSPAPATGAAAPPPTATRSMPPVASPAIAGSAIDTGMFAREHFDPGSFIQHGKPLTEMALRNQILSIYRDLRLEAEGRLIAMTLSRYWQENGLRAGDLRLGLDVLLRDGYLRQRLDGIDVFWVLTAEGEAYMKAPEVHAVLLQLSPAVGAVDRRPGDIELQHMLLHAWAPSGFAAGAQLGYPDLLQHWQRIGFDDNALLHALDWLSKRGWLAVQDGTPPRFELTQAGADHARSHLRAL